MSASPTVSYTIISLISVSSFSICCWHSTRFIALAIISALLIFGLYVLAFSSSSCRYSLSWSCSVQNAVKCLTISAVACVSVYATYFAFFATGFGVFFLPLKKLLKLFQNPVTSLYMPTTSSAVDLTSRNDSRACLYRVTPCLIAVRQLLAAKRMLIGSIFYPFLLA